MHCCMHYHSVLPVTTRYTPVPEKHSCFDLPQPSPSCTSCYPLYSPTQLMVPKPWDLEQLCGNHNSRFAVCLATLYTIVTKYS